MSPKPTYGESARFHLSDYRLVARHNFRVARFSGIRGSDSAPNAAHVPRLALRRRTSPAIHGIGMRYRLRWVVLR